MSTPASTRWNSVYDCTVVIENSNDDAPGMLFRKIVGSDHELNGFELTLVQECITVSMSSQLCLLQL